MNQTHLTHPRLERLQQSSLIAGAIGVALCLVALVIGLIGDTDLLDQFFRSWLLGVVFWVGITIGGLAILMLHNLVGGPWGYVIRRVLEAVAKNFPLMAVMFIPIVFGMHSIYEWTHADVVATDAILQQKEAYLNIPFFIGRSVFYFAVWIGFAFYITRSMRRLEDLGGSVVTRRLQAHSAIGLILVFLTGTFAAFDWMMSLEPHWFSTIYGMAFVVSGTLGLFCVAIIVLALMRESDTEVYEAIRPVYMHDLGNFLFAFMLLWAYISISQFIIIWSANLPEETPWYLRRTAGAWVYAPIIITLFHFGAPFILLLSRKIKRNATMLAKVAGLILFMHFVDTLWLVAPAFQHGSDYGFHVSWLDFAAPIGIGGLWFSALLRTLRRSSFLPLNVAVPKDEVEAYNV